MGRMIFVVGPESSGTRLMTRIFMELGYEGQDTHEQTLDNIKLDDELDSTKDIVFRRSVPHAQKIPELQILHAYFKNQGFDITTIITHRDFLTNCLSKVENGHSKEEEVATDILDQWVFIGENLRYLKPFIIVSSSQLFSSPTQTLVLLFNSLNIIDADNKAVKISNIVFNADEKRIKEKYDYICK